MSSNMEAKCKMTYFIFQSKKKCLSTLTHRFYFSVSLIHYDVQGSARRFRTHWPDFLLTAALGTWCERRRRKKEKEKLLEKCKPAALAKVIMHFLERLAGPGTANAAKWKSGSPSSLPDSFLKPTYLFPLKQQFKCFFSFFFRRRKRQKKKRKKEPRGFFASVINRRPSQ